MKKKLTKEELKQNKYDRMIAWKFNFQNLKKPTLAQIITMEMITKELEEWEW